MSSEVTLSVEELRRRVQTRIGRPAILDQIVSESLPVLRIMAVSGNRESFKRHETPDGVPWLRLAHARPDGSSEPLEDQGRLLNSIRGEQVGLKELRLVASHPGANLHQYGGTIRPRVAKMLAIPLTKEAKRVGSPRQNGFPRPLFVFRGANGVYLAEAVDDGEIVVHYALKKSVRVPARPYLGFGKKTLQRMERYLADRIEDYLTGTFTGQ